MGSLFYFSTSHCLWFCFSFSCLPSPFIPPQALYLFDSSWLRYLHFESKLNFKKCLLVFSDDSLINLDCSFQHCPFRSVVLSLSFYPRCVILGFAKYPLGWIQSMDTMDSIQCMSSSFSKCWQLPTILTEPLLGATEAMERVTYGNSFLQPFLLTWDKSPTAKAFSF